MLFLCISLWFFLALLSIAFDLPEKIVRKACTVLAVAALVIAVATELQGCAVQEPPGRTTAKPDPRDAVVVLTCQNSSFDNSTNDFLISLEPCCNAFAVRDGPGLAGVKLLTAAHCVFGARPGQDVTFNLRSELTGYVRYAHPPPHMARVLRIDRGYDRAQLALIELDDAQALGRAALGCGPSLPPEGSVHAIAGVFEWSYLDGHALARITGPDSGSEYSTDLDVRPGWSGSPALDSQGRAIGIVISCTPELMTHGKTCQSHSGHFSGLEGFW